MEVAVSLQTAGLCEQVQFFEDEATHGVYGLDGMEGGGREKGKVGGREGGKEGGREGGWREGQEEGGGREERRREVAF